MAIFLLRSAATRGSRVVFVAVARVGRVGFVSRRSGIRRATELEEEDLAASCR